MSQNELLTAVQELMQYRAMQEETAAIIEGLQDRIKAHMTEQELDTISAGQYSITYKDVTSTRIDTAALKKDLPEIWSEYGKTTTTKRFTVSAK